MKKMLACILVIAFMSSFSATTLASSEHLYTTEPVNLRTGPAIRYQIIRELPFGEQVEYVSTSGRWTKVLWNGQIGYVFSKYLSSDRIEEGSIAVAKSNVYVRTGPSIKYKRLGKMLKGEPVQIISTSGKWLKIAWGEKTGYVYRSYFVINNSQDNVNLNQKLIESQYFTQNSNIYLGVFMDSASNVLNIRVSSNADVDKITNDLQNIMGVKYTAFKVVRTILPAYVNDAYIKAALIDIGARYERLSVSQKQQCTLAGWGYNVQTDVFHVEIVDLTDEKVLRFKEWVSDWGPITFSSVSSLAVPR